MRNPLKRQPGAAPRKPLRERLADLTKAAARRVRNPDAKIGAFAAMSFEAYDLETPLKSPREWSAEFAGHALAMHMADRFMRMGKSELADLIQGAHAKDDGTPEIMFQALDAAQDTFDGWGKLLSLARSRYLVAACAAAQATDPQPTAAGPAATARRPPRRASLVP